MRNFEPFVVEKKAGDEKNEERWRKAKKSIRIAILWRVSIGSGSMGGEYSQNAIVLMNCACECVSRHGNLPYSNQRPWRHYQMLSPAMCSSLPGQRNALQSSSSLQTVRVTCGLLHLRGFCGYNKSYSQGHMRHMYCAALFYWANQVIAPTVTAEPPSALQLFGDLRSIWNRGCNWA